MIKHINSSQDLEMIILTPIRAKTKLRLTNRIMIQHIYLKLDKDMQMITVISIKIQT